MWKWLKFTSVMICALSSAVLLPAQVQNCHLEGQVFSLAGAPLKKASVRLQQNGQATPNTTPTNYTATSDNEGKFSIDDVVPGTYFLSAQRNSALLSTRITGQRYREALSSPLKLEPGQVMKDLVFKLTPQAMIFGKIVDEDGDPLTGFSIAASRWMFVNGKRQLQANGSSSSQADGTFVMGNLRAGRYYLAADSQNNRLSFGTDRSGDKKIQESYLENVFPECAGCVLRGDGGCAGGSRSSRHRDPHSERARLRNSRQNRRRTQRAKVRRPNTDA